MRPTTANGNCPGSAGETPDNALADFAEPAEQQVPGAGNERSGDYSERREADVSRMQSPRLLDGGLRQRQKIENGGGRYDREQIEGTVEDHTAYLSRRPAARL